jgi:mRNA-degrading endonuclease YafQ of YafQ-DinJ toxin-antitoxin module
VYATPEGNGAEYSKDNVPYKPEVWLKVSQSDLKDGDFTFIMGYPGFTTRYRTSNSAAWNLEYNYPFSIETFGNVIEMLDEMTENDPDGKIKVASLKKGLANTMKNYQGKVDGMVNTKYVEEKKEFEKEFTKWVNADPERKAKYGDILKNIRAEYEVIEKTKDRDNLLGYFQGLAGTELGIASYAYYVATEMDKPKKERAPGMNETAIEDIKDGLMFQYANLYIPADKEMLVMALEMADELPADQRIDALDYILENKDQSIEEWVNWAYETSELDNPDYAKSLFGMSVAELDALNDPFINMWAAINPLVAAYGVVYAQFAANVTDLRKDYIDALYEWKGAEMYPDANSTMRFTSGPVKGYYPEDAVWYEPFTTLKGVVAKDKNVEPFDAPDKLVKLYEKRDFGPWVDPELNDVPVAFLHQCDITGGNSGSPVMNAKGEIIGVAFDGNYEAMISDWQYDFDMQRTISVDIRYVLFITDKFADAGFILEEMGVKQ